MPQPLLHKYAQCWPAGLEYSLGTRVQWVQQAARAPQPLSATNGPKTSTVRLLIVVFSSKYPIGGRYCPAPPPAILRRSARAPPLAVKGGQRLYASLLWASHHRGASVL